MVAARTSRGRTRPARALAVLVAAALVVAACGDDDDDDRADSSESASEQSTDNSGPGEGSGTATTAGAGTDAPAGGEADPNGTLTVAWQLTLDTVDPLRNPNVQNVAYNFPVYDALIYRAPDGTLSPGLAKSWEWSEDGSTFTMTLQEGVTFHDGSELTSEVVKANLERLMAMEDSPVYSAVANIERVEATDPLIVTLHMTQPDATLEYSLADRAGMIVSGRALADGVDLNSNAIGAGPYRMVEFRPGDRIVYERFEEYWGDPSAAAAKRVVLAGIADGQARANGVLAGEYDAAYVTPSQVAQVEQAGLDIVAESSFWYINVYLNNSRSEFGNPLVRQALSYAVDREAICEAIYYGFCEPTIKPFPDDYWAGSPDIPDDYYTYDPDKARALLAEAGLEDGFEFELMIPAGSDPYPQFAELLQAQFADIGITMRPNPIDISQLATTYFAEKQSDALLGGAGQVPEPAQLFQGAFMSTSFANPGGGTPEGMDELVKEMFAALDQDERAELVREGTRKVVEEAVNLILLRPQIIYAVNDNVVNWQPSLVANYPIIRGVGVTS